LEKRGLPYKRLDKLTVEPLPFNLIPGDLFWIKKEEGNQLFFLFLSQME
jgi:hypothetical protein